MQTAQISSMLQYLIDIKMASSGIKTKPFRMDTFMPPRYKKQKKPKPPKTVEVTKEPDLSKNVKAAVEMLGFKGVL